MPKKSYNQLFYHDTRHIKIWLYLHSGILCDKSRWLSGLNYSSGSSTCSRYSDCTMLENSTKINYYENTINYEECKYQNLNICVHWLFDDCGKHV